MMTEKYLHYLWGSKQFPAVDTVLTNGESVLVKSIGEYNENLKGPDFKFGAVKFGDVVEYGSIEIHLKGSDWYTHNHHLDKNYDNVILHVVYENDKPVFQNGRQIPTLELKGFIDSRNIEKEKVNRFFNYSFPCANGLNQIAPFYLKRMIDLAMVKKLNTKQNQLREFVNGSNSEIFYTLLVVAFGMKVNQNLFLELLEELPYDLMLSLKKTGRLCQFTNALTEKLEHSASWNTKGMRPNGFPKVRINQLLRILEFHDLENLTDVLLKGSANEVLIYFYSACKSAGLTRDFAKHLSVNVLAPFFWWVGDVSQVDSFQDKSIKLLLLISPEKNNELNKIQEVFGNANNAYESQALIALNRFYCSGKKCLSCDIGNKVLNRL